MTMKKKIFLSNTAMVLVSLLILFGIGAFSIKLFKHEFMDVMGQGAALSEHTYEVQTLLLENQQNPVEWEKLAGQLAAYDFELYVSDMDLQEQYSNVRHSEWECIEELQQEEFSSEQVQLYSMERVTIARCLVEKDGNSYHIYATYCPEEVSLWGMDRGMFEMFLIVFVVSGIVGIGGLLLCCQFFTRAMIKRIMRPVDELNQAAVRIKEGNLEQPIQYEEPDEFGEVCQTFNAMQSHLKEEMEKTQRYEKARTEMVSGISHDLRTPLTSVKGFIKGMLDGVANTPEKQQQYLKISYQKACDMERLLQKLFFFSKLETGNMPFFLQKVELGQWLEKYVQEKLMEASEKNYELSLSRPAEPCMANVDVEQMKRVFDNLLENSLKYGEKQPLSIQISMEKREKEILLHVSDNGAGVPEAKLPHVFEQFYRGDESRNSKKDGSGLGLYVCKYIVEQQKGQIRAYNENGFTVEITLPETEEQQEG